MKKLIKPLVLQYHPEVQARAAQAGYWIYRPVVKYWVNGSWVTMEELNCTADEAGFLIVKDDKTGQYYSYPVGGGTICDGAITSNTYTRVEYVKSQYIPPVAAIAYSPAYYSVDTPHGFEHYGVSVAVLPGAKVTTLTVERGGRVRVVDATTEASLYEATLLSGEITSPAGTATTAGQMVVNVMPSGGYTYVWVTDAPGSLRIIPTDDVRAYGAPYDENSYVLAGEAPFVPLAMPELTGELDIASEADLQLLGQFDLTSVANVTGINYIETTTALDMQSAVELLQWKLLQASAEMDVTGTAELYTFVHGRAPLYFGMRGVAGPTTYVGDFATDLKAVAAYPNTVMSSLHTTEVGDLLADMNAVIAANTAGNYDYTGTLILAAAEAAHYGNDIVTSVVPTYAESMTDAALQAYIDTAAAALIAGGYSEIAAMLHPGTYEYVVGAAAYLSDAMMADPALAAYAQELADAIAAMMALATNSAILTEAAYLYVATAAAVADGSADTSTVYAHYAAGNALGIETPESVIAAAAALYNDVAATETNSVVVDYYQNVALAGAYSAMQDTTVTFGTGSVTVGSTNVGVGRVSMFSLGASGSSSVVASVNYGSAKLMLGSAGSLPVGGMASARPVLSFGVMGREDSTAAVGSAGKNSLVFMAGGTGSRYRPGEALVLEEIIQPMPSVTLTMTVKDTLELWAYGGLEVGGASTLNDMIELMARGGLQVGGVSTLLATVILEAFGGVQVGGRSAFVADSLVLIVTRTSDARGNPRQAVTRMGLGQVRALEYSLNGTLYVLTDDGVYTLTGPHADAAVQFHPAAGRRIRLNAATIGGRGTLALSAKVAGGQEYLYPSGLDPQYSGEARIIVGRGLVGQQLEVGVKMTGDAELASASTEIIPV